MSRGKVTAEERVEAAKACAEGRMCIAAMARQMGMDRSTVREWVCRYRAGGELALAEHAHYQFYSADFKTQVVCEYLAGNGSLREISAKFGLKTCRQLRDWIKVYNSGKDFGRTKSEGGRMNKKRATTQEERLAIVKDCIENGRDYGATATKYNVSYHQVRQWVQKYTELGEAGLEDRRGRRLASQQPRSEIEELRIKLARAEHERDLAVIENHYLKKLQELERRDASRK